MNATLPVLVLLGLLGLLSLRQAHHPGEVRDADRMLAVVAATQGVVVLVLATIQALALARG